MKGPAYRTSRSPRIFAPALSLLVLVAACSDDPGPPAAPEAPRGLIASALSPESIVLSWTDASENETGFKVERAPQGSASWQQAALLAANGTRYTDTDLEPLTSYQYRVSATGEGGPSGFSNTAAVTTLPRPPELVTIELPAGRVGSSYQAALEAAHGDGTYAWEVLTGALPAGLDLGTLDGSIGGVPEQAQVAEFEIGLRSADLLTIEALTLTVYGVLEVLEGAPWVASLGLEFSRLLQADGGDGANVWSILDGELPPGLALESSTGRIHGVAEELGAWDVTVGAESGDGQSAMADIEILVDLAPVEVLADGLQRPRAGQPYEQVVGAQGGFGGHSFAVVGGALPDGLTLETDGRLHGTPTLAGAAVATVEAQDEEGRRGELDIEFAVCEAALALEVGETVVRSYPDDSCGLVLPATADAYRVGLVARRADLGAQPVPTGLLLRLVAGEAGVVFPVGGAEAGSLTRVAAASPHAPDAGLDSGSRALAEATERLHLELREEERSARPNVADPRPSRLTPMPATYRAPPAAAEPEEERTFYVRDPETGNRVLRNATLRGTSESIYYYEDDGVVEESTQATDEEVQAVLDYYEAYGRDIIDDVFGGLGPAAMTNNFKNQDGPLVLPAADIDQNEGRFIVLQIPPTMMPSGAAAYVSSCDRRPRPENYNAGPFVCTGSNQAEITYLRRPSTAFYLGSTVHEAKHISSHGYAVFAERGFNPSWIEEGTAEIAKEKSSRDASGIVDGIEVGTDEVYPDGPGNLGAEQYGMAVVTSRSRSYLRASPISALIGTPNPNPNGSTIYGASWLFHRYLADNYAGADEDGFFRAMNQQGTGISQIEAATGVSFETLLSEFLVAIMVEGASDARDATLQRFYSYDHEDLSQNFDGTWPYLQSDGAFTTMDWVMPDSHYTGPNFFRFEGDGASSLRLDALASDGVPVDPLDGVVVTLTRVR